MKERKVREIVLFILLVSGVLWANDAEELFKDKCSSCHIDYIPQSKLLRNYEHNNSDLNLTAPTLTELSFRLRDQVGDRKGDKESQLMEIEEFLMDYLAHPNKAKTVLSKRVVQTFKTMPPLKITEEELEVLAPYMFDYSEKMMIKHSVPRYHYEEALAKAKKEEKIVLIEGYIPFCRGCMQMDREVFVEDEVKEALNKGFVVVKQNVLTEKLPLGLKSLGTPSFYFITNDGKHLIDQLLGTGTVEEFLDMLGLIQEQLKKGEITKK